MILRANSVAKTLFGYEAGQLEGLCIEALIPRDLREGHEQRRQDYQRAPRSRAMGTLSLKAVRRDGECFFAEVALSPQGGRGDVLAIVRDTTARLTAQNRRFAQDRIEAYEVASAGLIHEICNPMAFLLPSLELAIESLEGGSMGARRQALGALEEVRVGLTQISRVIDDFRGLMRPGAGPGRLDVRVVVEQV
ncbi:MAG: PAS domain S-box protein, partial [Myxococcales bacterium]|nr:PAS domain S-box protein [Myxococcales bacterium]